MFAIVEIAGQQFKVEKGRSYFVHRLPEEIGKNVSFDKVMLVHNDNNVTVGSPLIEGISINAKVLEHLKGDKVIVFKKKRRKGYRVKNGHRQCFTKILVEDIVTGTAKKAKAKKAKEVEEPVVVEEAAIEQPVTDNSAE